MTGGPANQVLRVAGLLRIRQWVKNGFVLAGLLFVNHRHSNDFINVGIGFLAFCAASSAVYILNDICDYEEDRKHPTKSQRPIASDAIEIAPALIIAILLAWASMGLGIWIGWKAGAIVTCYLIINLAYSLGLRQIPLLDVFIIAGGFMLRLAMGTFAISITPSHWLLLTGLMLTLFLGFCKREADPRPPYVLLGRRFMLEKFASIAAACTIMSYALYTMAPETIAYHNTHLLLYTVPFVVYGILRYLMLAGDDAATHLITDPHLIITSVLWLATTMAVCW